MSTDADLLDEAFDEPKKGGTMVVFVVLFVSLLGGSGAGWVIAPKLVADPRPEQAADSHSGGGGGGGHGGDGGGAGNLVELDNIIVNPAGTQGMRFLMATVALDVSEETVTALRENEMRLRDRVNSVLEAQTMAMLTAPGARDSLKTLIAVALAEFLEGEGHPRIYIPHFVIQ